ncbi:NUDIX hydrolase [Clostridium rhizosphaerae]|uniref:NUDIX hydrolase n=1 Tax=Clostridium rhizosphaerae TaxID=2803861 RepID=UPI001FAFED22|nr:NUDIX domain-containing protein [Clostridium rhizosphaerae]
MRTKFAVNAVRYKDRWIFVRHKDMTTWEIPGGHREEGENIKDTAYRELFEEIGAKEFRLYPVCIYSVDRDGEESFGQLFYAEVEELGDVLMYYMDVLNRFNISAEEFSSIYLKKFESNMKRDYKKQYEKMI